MTDYNDGEWHGWNSRHRPDGVHPESLVTFVWHDVWHDEETGRCGVECDTPARKVVWPNTIKFRVTKPFQEPRVIWVNEYKNGYSGIAHQSPERAKQAVSEGVARVAVRFVEASE